jgi:hypothetical protein
MLDFSVVLVHPPALSTASPPQTVREGFLPHVLPPERSDPIRITTMRDLYFDDIESKTYSDKMILEDSRALMKAGQREGPLLDYKRRFPERQLAVNGCGFR